MLIETAAERARLECYLLTTLDKAIANWRTQFDEPPEIDLNFSIDPARILRLNGITLCPIHQLSLPLQLECYDDLFVLPTASGQIIEISIVWPYEDNPYISNIAAREYLYISDRDDAT